MASTQQQIEALKLIGDWCKWIVTVETAAIAAIGAYIKFGQSASNSIRFQYSCTFAILCFISSMFFAAGIISAIPTSVTEMAEGDAIWDRMIYGPYDGEIIKFRKAASFLFGLFALGVTFFGAAVCLALWAN